MQITKIFRAHRLWSTFALLGILYVAEGLPVGFFSQALPVLMRKQGYSLGDIGLVALLAIPWGLGFLWAPLVDRFGAGRANHRRRWIIPVQLIAASLLFFIGMFPGQGLHRLFVVILVINLLTTTQEIATDALAVDRMRAEERGLGSGIQTAGFRIGMIVGGGLLLIFYEQLGWRGTLAAMGSILLLTMLPVLLMSEPARPIPNGGNTSLLFPREHFLRQPGVWRQLMILMLYKAGETMAVGMARPFFIDQGLSMRDIGWLLGTVGTICSLLGGIVGGALINPLGRRRALILFGLLQAVTVLGYALAASGLRSHLAMYVLAGMENFTGGMGLVALYTVMLDWCRPQSNATDISVQVSAMMLAQALASSLGGYSAQALGYRGHFVLSAVLAVGGVLLVLALFRGRQRVALSLTEPRSEART